MADSWHTWIALSPDCYTGAETGDESIAAGGYGQLPFVDNFFYSFISGGTDSRHMWQSEDLWEVGLSLYHIDPGDSDFSHQAWQQVPLTDEPTRLPCLAALHQEMEIWGSEWGVSLSRHRPWNMGIKFG